MKKNIDVTDIIKYIQQKIDLRVNHKNFYLYKDDHWEKISEDELMILIRDFYEKDDQESISTGKIKETVERLSQHPDHQLSFFDEENENYVNLINGLFNVPEGKLEEHSLNKAYSYILGFNYISRKDRSLEAFDKFVATSFPRETDVKKTLLLQIMGYVISDYTKAKSGFFLIGESNSGKSTILELIRKIVPEKYVTSIPLYNLANRFNLARLSESRLNISTELSEKSFAVSDIFKMATSNEMVTAEHKGKKPFEFRIKTKLINAGNILPTLDKVEGMSALLNRMVILLFPVSVPKEKQEINLLSDLEKEKDSIFSAALDALSELQKNHFRFTEPQDSIMLKTQLADRCNVIENFLMDSCVREKNARVHMVDLYEAFQKYCANNCLDICISKSAFSQRLSRIPGLQRGKFRLYMSKPLSGIIGVRLKTESEYIRQDSEVDSDESQHKIIYSDEKINGEKA